MLFAALRTGKIGPFVEPESDKTWLCYVEIEVMGLAWTNMGGATLFIEARGGCLLQNGMTHQ